MKKPFFIIIQNQRGDGIMAMTEETGEIATFETVREATDAANGNDAATCFGWDLFQVGCGIDGGDGL